MNMATQSDDIGKLILRLMLGVLMLFHGVAKILNMGTLDFIKSKLVDFGMPDLLAYGVYIGEIVAPLLIIFGIYTRFGGFIIFVNMIFAIFLVHAHELLSLTQHGGWALELQGFYLLSALVIVLVGSGRIAVRPD